MTSVAEAPVIRVVRGRAGVAELAAVALVLVAAGRSRRGARNEGSPRVWRTRVFIPAHSWQSY